MKNIIEKNIISNIQVTSIKPKRINRTIPQRCRGINHDQFRAADRLACNYQRAFLSGGRGFTQIKLEKDFSKMHRTEIQLQAICDHKQVFAKLNQKSQEIIEHFCLAELPMRQFELRQVPEWPKGVGSARLREALDDLVEIYRTLSSIPSKNLP